MFATPRPLSAAFWSAGEGLSRFGLQFCFTVILSRLLTPDAFGLIVMLLLVSGLGTIVIDSGLTAALVQCKEPSPLDESTVFFFSVGVAVAVALAVGMAGPLIATFFDQPLLQLLTWVVGLDMVVGSLGTVHRAQLVRMLDFKSQMRIGVVASAVSGCVAVLLALEGWGVWSLAFQSLISTTITVVLLWFSHPWRPTRVFSLQSLRVLLRFGQFVAMARVLDALYTRAYSLVVGRFYGAEALGFYNRGLGTAQIPAGLISETLHRVAFPLFSRTSEDKLRTAEGVRRALLVISLVNAPLMLGLLVAAEPLVLTLFGDQWRPATPILQVLCLVGLISPLEVINASALLAQGHPDLMLRAEAAKKLIGLVAIMGAGFIGVMAVAWSQVLVALLGFLLSARYGGVVLGYSVRRQALDVLPGLGLAAGIAWGLWWLRDLCPCSAPVALALLSAVGVPLYLLGCHLLRLDAYLELRRLLVSQRVPA